MQIIEEIDQHAQPGVIPPIERENQPRQFRQRRFVTLDRQGGAGAEGSVLQQIRKLPRNLRQFRFADRMVKTQDDIISRITQAVIVAVEMPDLANGFVDVVGDFV